MNKIEMAERLAAMWKKARMDAGKSQEYVAKALGVSKKTVQNWEEGTSSPSQLKGLEYFSALGLQPLPYYLEVFYPSEFGGISSEDSDERIEEALITYIKGTTPNQRRKMLFLLYGDHGSSPNAIIEMVTAHLHCELRARLNIASNIITNYEIAEYHKTMLAPTHVKPDMKVLKSALEHGYKAVLRHENSYNNAEAEQ